MIVVAERPRTSRVVLSMAEPHVCAPIDANGNLTSDGVKTYAWNALNQLVEVKEGTTTLATFVYDGAGRRVEKSASGITHTYVYDAEDIVEERLSGSGSGSIRYYHGTGIDEPLARKNSSDVVTYYLADHLGSIVQETDASGDVTLEREYDPWGAPQQGANAGGYAFTGREWDNETSLYYYRARYLDPTRGRFLGEDPIGLAGGLNLHQYVGSNPITLIDPAGLNPFVGIWPGVEIGGTVGGPVGAVVGGIIGGLIGWQVGQRIWNQFFAEETEPPDQPKRHTPDQEAVVDLAKEAKSKGGLSEKEAKILVDFGKEAGLSTRGPEVHPGRPFGQKPHIHIGPVNHIPVCSIK